MFFYENGKVAKVPLSSYATKTNRKKLTGAYNGNSLLVTVCHITEETEFLLTATSGRRLLFHSASINAKPTRSTQGVGVMRFKKGHNLMSALKYNDGDLTNPARYRTKTLPALGAMPSADENQDLQLSLL